MAQITMPKLGNSIYSDGKRLALRTVSDHYNTMDGLFDSIVERVKTGNSPQDFKDGFFDTVEALVSALSSSELDDPGSEIVDKKSQVWICGNGHSFKYGDKDWHYEAAQGRDEENYPIPAYCTVGNCMDSSSLYPQF